jgi:hypothetical protein
MEAGADRPVDRVLPVIDGPEIVLPWGERLPRPDAV